jgi:hypothetical protein
VGDDETGEKEITEREWMSLPSTVFQIAVFFRRGGRGCGLMTLIVFLEMDSGITCLRNVFLGAGGGTTHPYKWIFMGG